jgi:hypothetical protein
LEEQMSDRDAVVSGVAAGVPYVALPPAGRYESEPASLIIAWHLNDPPRSAAAMAAALPRAAATAWRVYLDLPMHGRRQLPGGLEEFMRLGYQDAVLNTFEPQVTQAVDEFPGVLAELRAQLPVTAGPIGVVGASVGALPAQLVMAGRAGIVELTDTGKALAGQVKQLWCALAEETVTGLPAQTVAELPGILNTLTGNVDTRRPRHLHDRRDGG